jgi:hypothetical protein
MSQVKRTAPTGPKRKRDENENPITKKIATSPLLPKDAGKKHEKGSNATKSLSQSLKIEDVNEALSHMDSSLLADHFAKQ